MTAYTVHCPNGHPTRTDRYVHVCDDCNLARDHDPQATWTVIGNDCAKGFPDCRLGDGHTDECGAW